MPSSPQEVIDWITTHGGIRQLTSRQQAFVEAVVEGKTVEWAWPRRDGKTTIILKLGAALRALYPDKTVCVIGAGTPYACRVGTRPGTPFRYDRVVRGANGETVAAQADFILVDNGPVELSAVPAGVVATLFTSTGHEERSLIQKFLQLMRLPPSTQ